MKNFMVKANGTAKTTVMDERVNLDDNAALRVCQWRNSAGDP